MADGHVGEACETRSSERTEPTTRAHCGCNSCSCESSSREESPARQRHCPEACAHATKCQQFITAFVKRLANRVVSVCPPLVHYLTLQVDPPTSRPPCRICTRLAAPAWNAVSSHRDALLSDGGKRFPRGVFGVLLVDRRSITQQVRPAFLLIGLVSCVVWRPEIRNQRARVNFGKKILQSWQTTTAVNHIRNAGVICKATKPACFKAMEIGDSMSRSGC